MSNGREGIGHAAEVIKKLRSESGEGWDGAGMIRKFRDASRHDTRQ